MARQKPLAISALPLLFANTLLYVLIVTATNAPISASHCLGLDACLANLRNGHACGVLPIPPQARLPAISPGSFLLTKLRTSVWAYQDGLYNSLMLFRADHLVLVDFPDSDNSNTQSASGTLLTDAILRILGRSTPRLIDMVYSHDHFDHIGAAKRVYNFLKQQYPHALITIWGTSLTKHTIENSSSKRALLPTNIIDNSARFIDMVDGLRIQMFPVGGHSGQDLAVYIPPSAAEQGVLMFVDVIYPKWAPFSSFSGTEDLRAFVRAHERVLSLDFGSFVGGHVHIGTKADVLTSLEFTNDVIGAARQAAQMSSAEDFARAGFGQFLNPEAVEFGNIWYAFVNVVRKVQTQSCAQIVLRKWGCRLGGIGVVVESHCFTALQFVLLDD